MSTTPYPALQARTPAHRRPHSVIVRPVLCRPFIGRREELGYLQRRRLEAASSRGGLVVVSGDAGVGKSRLLGEFCDSLGKARGRIARTGCTEYAGRPYGPILDALSRLDPGGPELPATPSRRDRIEALVARLTDVAARNAVLIAIEDIHWADTATLDSLARLGAAFANQRALIVVTVRSSDVAPGSARAAAIAKIERDARAARIELAPLEGFELQSFITEALAQRELPERTVHAIARASEGNPFYAEELLKSTVERDDRRDGGVAVPASIRTALLERFARLDSEDRRIVAQAAVIGRSFGIDLLAATLATEASLLLGPLRRARDLQLVEEREPGTFRFRHGLTREAIYADFLASELRPLHRTVALAIADRSEDEATLSQLAYHWWAAGDAERCFASNERAGDAAVLVHAHEDAIGYFERALASEGQSELTRAGVLEKVAERRVALTWTEQARATFAAAADLYAEAGAYDREADCRMHAALLAYMTAMPSPTAPLEAMLERLAPDQRLARARVHVGIAWLAATFGFPTRAAHHLSFVDANMRAEIPDVARRVHNIAAWIAMTVGDLATFRTEYAAWLAAAEIVPSPRALGGTLVNGAMCHTFFGLHDEAHALLDRAAALAHEARNPAAIEGTHAFRAFCSGLRGDLRTARAATAHVPVTTEDHVNFTFATASGTLVAAHTGDREMTERWFEGLAADESRKLEIEVGGGIAELLVRRGRHDEAAALLHRVLPECEMVRGNVPTLLAIGRYGWPADRARARQYLVRASVGTIELPEAAALSLFDAYDRAREGRTDEAAHLARDAAAAFGRLGMALFEAQALEAARDVAGALAVYRRCGASEDVRRLEPPARPVLGGAQASLSARESEIALLAIKGYSNVEIARELTISPKTVEKHVASIFLKLGISSRRQLHALTSQGRPAV